MMSDFGAALNEVAVPFIPFYNLLKFAPMPTSPARICIIIMVSRSHEGDKPLNEKDSWEELIDSPPKSP